jgi:hypothetical protein
MDIAGGGNSARLESSIEFPAVMDVTATYAMPFSKATAMVMSGCRII